MLVNSHYNQIFTDESELRRHWVNGYNSSNDDKSTHISKPNVTLSFYERKYFLMITVYKNYIYLMIIILTFKHRGTIKS